MVIVETACVVGGAAAVCGLWKCNKVRIEHKLAKLVETIAPKALAGSKVDLEQLHLAVGRRTNVALSALTLHNLEGFLSDSLLTLGKIDVTVNTGKAVASRGKQIQISGIVIENCHLTFEKQLRTSNVKLLLKRLKAADADKKKDTNGEAGANATKSDQAGAKATKSDRKVIVNKVYITGVKATMTATEAIKFGIPGNMATISVPPIEIDDFDRKYGNVSPDKLIQILIENILNAVLMLVESAGSPMQALNTVEGTCSWFLNSIASLFKCGS